MEKSAFQDALLHWYQKSKRTLPWRDNPLPYFVWVSEIMLQQTRVEAVIPYFNRFIQELPTIEALANVEEDKLYKLWEGLGYYARVRNLQKAAKIVVRDYAGVLPDNKVDLESLPGIGPYTSSAILAIAFEKQTAAVDGNVLRVFARLMAITKDIKDPKTKKMIKEQVTRLVPNKNNRDFTQALMEIGATICIPNGSPRCNLCPLSSFCIAYQKQLTEEIPVTQKKKQRTIEKITVLILEYNDLFAIRKRPNKGLLANLYEYPNISGLLTKKEVRELYPNAISIQQLPEATHIFTHKEWHMVGFQILMDDKKDGYIYVNRQAIQTEYSIPRAFRTYTKTIFKPQKKD